VQFRGAPLIWFDRNNDGLMMLSLRMLSQTQEPRLQLDHNDWLLIGTPTDFVCPPSGRSISATFSNGDTLSLGFAEVPDPAAFLERFPSFREDHLAQFTFPSTALEIQMAVGGTTFRLGPEHSTFGGVMMRGCVTVGGSVGVALG
jgi:hypothetical protein